MHSRTIFSFIGLAAFLNYKSSSEFVYLIWMVFSLSVLASSSFFFSIYLSSCNTLSFALTDAGEALVLFFKSVEPEKGSSSSWSVWEESAETSL